MDHKLLEAAARGTELMLTLHNTKREELDPVEVFTSLSSTIDIPEGKLGDFAVTQDHLPQGKVVTIISVRNALMMGWEPLKVRLPFPMTIHNLSRNDDRLMSDSLQERFLHRQAIHKARGKVLVGGLGLGYIASKLAQKPEVTEVTVVEIQPEVVELVWKHVKQPKVKLIQGDLFEFLKKTRRKFDFQLYDIWYGTGETEFSEYVVPLRRLGRRCRRNGGEICCWAEEEMMSQVASSLMTCLTLPEDDPWLNGMPEKVAFRRGVEECTDIGSEARSFLTNVGSSEWEERWGRFWP